MALERLRVQLAVGAPVGDLRALPGRARRAVTVALAVGAPALPALRAATGALADVRRSRRAVQVATAQARAVATGLVAAPVVLVPALGRLLGTDLAAFYTTPAGVAVAVAAGGLMTVGAGVVAALVRRVGRPPRPSSAATPVLGALAAALLLLTLAGPVVAVLGGLAVWWRAGRRPDFAPPSLEEAADLTAVALAGGTSHGEALRLAAQHLPVLAGPLRRLGLALDVGDDARPGHLATDEPAGFARLRDVLATSAHWGAPAATSLHQLAAELRADELARVLAAAERLPAQLTFPTALCLLPATLVLVGAPLIVEGLRVAGA